MFTVLIIDSSRLRWGLSFSFVDSTFLLIFFCYKFISTIKIICVYLALKCILYGRNFSSFIFVRTDFLLILYFSTNYCTNVLGVSVASKRTLRVLFLAVFGLLGFGRSLTLPVSLNLRRVSETVGLEMGSRSE